MNTIRIEFKRVYNRGHEKIDEAFGTDLTYVFSDEGQQEWAALEKRFGIEEKKPKILMGEIPPPGSLIVVGKNAVTLAKTARIAGAVVGAAAIGSQLTPAPTPPQVVEKSVTVYRSINKTTGDVDYVGITKNLGRRALEHLRDKGIAIKPIDNLPELSRADARAC